MPPGSGNLLILAIPLLLLIFMIWSQRRRQQEIATLQSSITAGDRVVTTSGIYGTVREIAETTAQLEVSPGVTLTVDRRAIGSKAV